MIGPIGSHGASKHVQIIAFPTSNQAVKWLQTECSCHSIVGLLGSFPDGYESMNVFEDTELGSARLSQASVESNNGAGQIPDSTEPLIQTNQSFPVHTRPFSSRGNTCIAISKKERGLPISLAKHCTQFVHVPHFSMDAASPLLDCPSCLSITLHEFTEHVGYSERNFQGHKFDVVQPLHLSGDEDRKSERIQERQEMQRAVEAAASDGALGTMFGGQESDGDY
jgi:hypothetical protein